MIHPLWPAADNNRLLNDRNHPLLRRIRIAQPPLRGHQIPYHFQNREVILRLLPRKELKIRHLLGQFNLATTSLPHNRRGLVHRFPNFVQVKIPLTAGGQCSPRHIHNTSAELALLKIRKRDLRIRKEVERANVVELRPRISRYNFFNPLAFRLSRNPNQPTQHHRHILNRGDLYHLIRIVSTNNSDPVFPRIKKP